MFTDYDTLMKFLTSKKPIFTIKSLATGQHYSYQLKSSTQPLRRTPSVSFVTANPLGSGSTYIGHISWAWLVLSSGVKGDAQHPAFTPLHWYIKQLHKGSVPTAATLEHNGTCGKCGRPLTDPDSIQLGLGPTCAKG